MKPAESIRRRNGAQQERSDRASRAYGELRELILRGQLAPGARIIETDIAERLGISRTPVRGALQRLQHEGYIVASGRGVQARLSVAPLTKEDARELFSIIAHVEGLAVRAAASLPEIERKRIVNELRHTNDNLLHASQAPVPDLQELFTLDERFHRVCVEGGAGPRLLMLHNAVKPQSQRYGRLYVSALVSELSASVREHQRIIDELEAGNADGAECGIQENWRNALGRLEGVIESIGERGTW